MTGQPGRKNSLMRKEKHLQKLTLLASLKYWRVWVVVGCILPVEGHINLEDHSKIYFLAWIGKVKRENCSPPRFLASTSTTNATNTIVGLSDMAGSLSSATGSSSVAGSCPAVAALSEDDGDSSENKKYHKLWLHCLCKRARSSAF
ncbi:unnamed protein product [Mucor fragilis]